MNKLQQLDEALITFTGETVVVQETPLTHRIAILNCLGSMQTESGMDAIRVYTLGTRLYAAPAEDAFEVSADDMGLIRSAVEQNKPTYVPYIQGQLLTYLGVSE